MCDSLPVRNPTSISASELHSTLVQLHRHGAETKLRFVSVLRTLYESRLYLLLGASSIHQYSERHFGYQRSETYEQLRVAEALDNLPGARAAFLSGKLSWSALKAVTRVAKPKTEHKWLDLARRKTLRQLQAEVQDAVLKGRDTPREDMYGLPRVSVRVVFEYLPEEHAIVDKALQKVSAELGESLGGEAVEPHRALLYLAERVLETDAKSCGNRVEADASPFTVLYHQCPSCQRAGVVTPEGLVEVPPEVIDRVAGEAARMEIDPERVTSDPEPDTEVVDGPSSPALRRRVLLRDGAVCASPFCRRTKSLQAHHIVFRSWGGKTVERNEVTLCGGCHALVHAGLLQITGNAVDGLEWKPAAAGIESEIQIEPAPDIGVRTADSGVSAIEIRALAKGLERIGFSRREAQSRLEKALAQLGAEGREITDEVLLREAIRA